MTAHPPRPRAASPLAARAASPLASIDGETLTTVHTRNLTWAGDRSDPARPTPGDPLLGRVLAGRYEIESLLGEGGMGRVYRARHLRMSRRFAVKVMRREHALQDKMVRRFQREAEATSRLSHPNLVGVIDFGETDDDLRYLVMEYVEGPTLRDLIRDGAPLPAPLVIDLACQLSDGLAHAHGRGLVHRDFKPDNIIIERTDEHLVARITDFGIAYACETDTDRQRRLTSEGLILGTPHYMAPEQLCAETVDHRADLYGLGVVLYEMLSGSLPYGGPGGLVAQLHISAPLPPIARRVPGLSVDPLVEELAGWLLAKRPERRPPSAREVGRILRLIASDRTAAAAALPAHVTPAPDGFPAEPVTTVMRRPPPPSAEAPRALDNRVAAPVSLAIATPTRTPSAPAARRVSTSSMRTAQRPRRQHWPLFAFGAASALVAVLLGGGGAPPGLTPMSASTLPVEAASAAAAPAPSPAPRPAPTAPAPSAPAVTAAAPPAAPRSPASSPGAPPPSAPPAAPQPSAPPAAPSPQPAAPTVSIAVVNTIPMIASPSPASSRGATRRRDRRRDKHRDADRGAARDDRGAARPGARACESTALPALRTAYAATGERLELLATRRGTAAAAPLQQRYLAIPLVDALRDPSRSGGLACRVADLRADVERALTAP